MKIFIAATCLFVATAAQTTFGQLFLAGPDSTNVPCGTSVTLTTSVEDTNGLAVIVTWWLNGIPVETNAVLASDPPTPADFSITGVFPSGTNIVDVVAENSDSLMVTNTAIVIETDTNPPAIIGAAPSIASLWPPNHKMVRITVTAQTTDDCGDVTWKIVDVQSNEPVNGKGDGNTSPDWQVLSDHTLNLRSERSGKGSGRIYTISLQAEDSMGNLSETNKVYVVVPKSKGKSPVINPGNENENPTSPGNSGNHPGKGKGKNK